MSESQAMTGGDVVVQTLKTAGVELVFGVISIHNIPIFDALARDGGIRLVASRSEAGAVNMADAYARAGGRLAVAISSTGTGAGNACGALLEAQTAGSPVLHLTGQIDTAYLDQGKGYIHEVRDQLTMLRGASKRAYRLTHAAELTGLLRQAMHDALEAPRGPVSIELPINLQSSPHPGLPQIAWQPPDGQSPDAASVEAAAKLLAGASRPLIFAGGGVIASDAAAELTAVAERLGAAVLTSNSGRGSIPEDHPQCLGNWIHSRTIWPFLESCDAVLIAGSHLRGNETVNWSTPLPSAAVQIDADPRALGRSYPVELGIAADARLALRALLQALPKKPLSAVVADGQAAVAVARGQLERSLGPYLPLTRYIREALPRDTLFVRDVTVPASTWGNRLFPIYTPRTNIFAVGGGIGQGLQMAIGAQLAQRGRRVLCIAGDGGLMVNIGEMATAVEQELPIVLLLFNDGGYGVLRSIQNVQYGARHIGVDLRQAEFQSLARSMGWQAWQVRDPAAFAPAFNQALEAHAPALVELDMPAVGPIDYAGPPANR